MLITWGSEPNSRLEEIARTVVETPFTRRTWSELLFLTVGMPIAFIGIAFVGVTMAAGIVLAVTFIGIALIGVAVRGARGIGGMQRRLAGALLDETIAEPEPFAPRPGYLGWLQSALRDRTGWKAMAYLAIKVPLTFVALFTAFSLWWDAFRCLTYPLWGISNHGGVADWGFARLIFHPAYLTSGNGGPFVALATVITGAIFFFIAPWPVRFFDYLDRLLMRSLLAPDAMTVRVRNLEYARAQTVDASAATLRRIERDLHDGTQAQLVALAMRLGMAKEKLADPDHSRYRPGEAARQRCPQRSQGGDRRVAGPGPGHPPTGPRRGARGCSGHAGSAEHDTDRALRHHRRAPQPGHRGHRLFLRGRAHGQRRPARLRLPGQRLL